MYEAHDYECLLTLLTRFVAKPAALDPEFPSSADLAVKSSGSAGYLKPQDHIRLVWARPADQTKDPQHIGDRPTPQSLAGSCRPTRDRDGGIVVEVYRLPRRAA